MNKAIKHGLTKHELYPTWYAMLRRCYDKKFHGYKYYGAKGIDVSKEWHSVKNFINDMDPRPDGHTIDRLDNSEGYSKENCQWSTRIQQENNKCTNLVIEYCGHKDTLANWCRTLDIPYQTVKKRIQRGWAPERAFTKKTL